MSLRSSRATAVALVTLATFTDILAYSVSVPVLPDLARRLGASPTIIGLLFASFGVTLLLVAVPMGAASDRIGRRRPLVGGMLALAGATALFAVADSLPWLFAARLVQGAADGVTWVVGFALVADLYGPSERGRVMGYVMSGTSFGLVVGPSVGGWLYEAGGIVLPFACVAAMALLCAVGFQAIAPAGARLPKRGPTIWSIVREPGVATCGAIVIVAASTIAMLEPALALFFSRSLGLGPARIGLLFGGAAVASAVMPFVFGPLTDRWGGRRLTLVGLLLMAAWMPMLVFPSSFPSALVVIVVQSIAISLFVTPSLAYMAEVTSFAGEDAYGVGYGVYNTAWGVGLVGPALGGWLFEHLGFGSLMVGWAAAVIVAALLLWRLSRPNPSMVRSA